MKKFITHIAAFSVIVLALHLILAFAADGSTDYSYMRFATPEQRSLIIGTSRAAQGVMPDQIDSVLESEIPMFNFAFSLVNSPFGETYNKAIFEKLSAETLDGLFIIAIDPWSLAMERGLSAPVPDQRDGILDEMHFFNSHPNYEYLWRNYPDGWGRPLLKRIESSLLSSLTADQSGESGSWAYLHDNGWLEVFTSIDSGYIRRNTDIKLRSYEELAPTLHLSDYRIKSLEELMDHLQEHGEVVLIRIPTHPRMLALEEEFAPEFNELALDLSNRYEVPFYDLTDRAAEYTYTDGNHLYKTSAKEISIRLAQMIKEEFK